MLVVGVKAHSPSLTVPSATPRRPEPNGHLSSFPAGASLVPARNPRSLCCLENEATRECPPCAVSSPTPQAESAFPLRATWLSQEHQNSQGQNLMRDLASTRCASTRGNLLLTRAQLVILFAKMLPSHVCHYTILIPKVTFIFHVFTVGKYPTIVLPRG